MQPTSPFAELFSKTLKHKCGNENLFFQRNFTKQRIFANERRMDEKLRIYKILIRMNTKFSFYDFCEFVEWIDSIGSSVFLVHCIYPNAHFSQSRFEFINGHQLDQSSSTLSRRTSENVSIQNCITLTGDTLESKRFSRRRTFDRSLS